MMLQSLRYLIDDGLLAALFITGGVVPFAAAKGAMPIVTFANWYEKLDFISPWRLDPHGWRRWESSGVGYFSDD